MRTLECSTRESVGAEIRTASMARMRSRCVTINVRAMQLKCAAEDHTTGTKDKNRREKVGERMRGKGRGEGKKKGKRSMDGREEGNERKNGREGKGKEVGGEWKEEENEISSSLSFLLSVYTLLAQL